MRNHLLAQLIVQGATSHEKAVGQVDQYRRSGAISGDAKVRTPREQARPSVVRLPRDRVRYTPDF